MQVSVKVVTALKHSIMHMRVRCM